MTHSREYALGIDLGGTYIKTILVDSQGTDLGWESRKTEFSGEGPQEVLDRMAESALKVLAQAKKKPGDLKGLGIGFPGPIDRKTGRIIWPTNLGNWKNIDLSKELFLRLGVSCFIENDANAAAYAEAWQGQGRGKQDLVVVTLGTGVGGGLVLGGRVWHGHQDTAGEIGHQCMNPEGPLCGCGQKGCLEAYASASAIVRNAEKRMKAKGLDRIGNMTSDTLTSKGLGEAAQAGDPLAQELFREAAFYLGLGIVNLINVLNPEMIVLAGGLSRAGTLLLDPVRTLIQERALDPRAKKTPVLITKLGEKAGALGAAGIIFEANPT